MLKISSTDRAFVLTGAGVSAESGIPTFRDMGGLWESYAIEDVASPSAWIRDPRLVWEFYSVRRRALSAAKPNLGHIALAKLENTLQDRLFLCTQNIDNLHELAGSRNVVHMHGELFKSRCDACSRPPFADLKLYERPAEIPFCQCGGQIRPHVCWFGEVPFEMERVLRQLARCTLFLAIGTSGEVQPAASLVARAPRGTRTIYIGPEKPANSSSFKKCYLGRAGEMLPKLLG
jgi:NAD-dependent deacetylase